MQDLNDLFYFAEVVKHGGFAPAGRALAQPKSKFSRRVARLEQRLGARLIERSTRKFRVTDAGRQFYERCTAMLAEAAQAEAEVAALQNEPHGVVRLACPIGALSVVGPVLVDFMKRFPRVNLQVIVANRSVDVIGEGIDLALRVRAVLDADASLTRRTIGKSRRVLVASPAFANKIAGASGISALTAACTLSSGERPGEETWDLVGPEGDAVAHRHLPRYSVGDFAALRMAAEAGLGIALLPEDFCREALETGRLVIVFPGWHAPEGVVHLVFPSRRGLPPAVRALIDMLAAHFRMLT